MFFLEEGLTCFGEDRLATLPWLLIVRRGEQFWGNHAAKTTHGLTPEFTQN